MTFSIQMCQFILALIVIERKEKQCQVSYVTERKKKDDSSWESNDIPSAIWTYILGQLD